VATTSRPMSGGMSAGPTVCYQELRTDAQCTAVPFAHAKLDDRRRQKGCLWLWCLSTWPSKFPKKALSWPWPLTFWSQHLTGCSSLSELHPSIVNLVKFSQAVCKISCSQTFRMIKGRTRTARIQNAFGGWSSAKTWMWANVYSFTLIIHRSALWHRSRIRNL